VNSILLKSSNVTQPSASFNSAVGNHAANEVRLKKEIDQTGFIQKEFINVIANLAINICKNSTCQYPSQKD